MSSKRLAEMGSNPGGEQVFAFMKYAMKSWPKAMTDLYEVYGYNHELLLAWCTGFAYCLSLVEDNGVPLDIDRVLYNWAESEGAFHIDQACEEWLRDNRG